jgi:hypothetical protein
MDEEEKKLLEGFNRLCPSNRHIALAQIIAAAEMEENARKIARKRQSGRGGRLSDPSYVLMGPGPVMEAQA